MLPRLLIIPFLIALLTTACPAHAAAPTCAMFLSFNDPQLEPIAPPSCDEMTKPGSAVYKKFPDGTFLPSMNAARTTEQDGPPQRDDDKVLGELAKLQNASPRQKIDVMTMATRMRAIVVEELMNDPASSVTKQLLAEKVAATPIKLDVTTDECAGLTPNARYLSLQGEIVICKNAMNLPPEALALALAHEFAHVVDPCFQGNNISNGTLETLKPYAFSKLAACVEKLPIIIEKSADEVCTARALEYKADLLGGKFLARFFEKHSSQMHADRLQYATYIMNVLNCIPYNSRGDYVPPGDRSMAYLQQSKIQSLVGCDVGHMTAACGDKVMESANPKLPPPTNSKAIH